MRFLLVLSFLISSLLWAAPEGRRFCKNRSVYMELNKNFAEAAKNQLLVINSLPFEVKKLSESGNLVTLQISYRRLTTGDSYEEPLALDLASQVYGIFKANVKKWGIRKIWAEFVSEEDC